MGSELFVEFARKSRASIDEALKEYLPRCLVEGSDGFNRALEYAVFPGGKRVRAYLTLIAARLAGNSEKQALPLACAIEFIHTSSIIIDDLPSMDDADLRRGRSSLHLVFGEASAILVAVALLNQSYALFSRGVRADVPIHRLQRLLAEASECIGHGGMIAGQAAELALSGSPPSEELVPTQGLKTTALMRLMVIAGAIASGWPEAKISELANFGECLGRAYQIYDDLTDLLGDTQLTGKTVGQDMRHMRPSLTQMTRSHRDSIQHLVERAGAMVINARQSLIQFEDQPEVALLHSAADFILEQFDGLASLSPSAASGHGTPCCG
jgi:geranylgeranyl diphosphate synthase, type II